MLYRRELCDLNDPIEGPICLRIAGLSLVPEPGETHKITVSDETQQSRNRITNTASERYNVSPTK
jgi:hypothetical protein